ncbi:hypothetical protein FOZ63_018900, partial [Perkinsus olseni]
GYEIVFSNYDDDFKQLLQALGSQPYAEYRASGLFIDFTEYAAQCTGQSSHDDLMERLFIWFVLNDDYEREQGQCSQLFSPQLVNLFDREIGRSFENYSDFSCARRRLVGGHDLLQ